MSTIIASARVAERFVLASGVVVTDVNERIDLSLGDLSFSFEFYLDSKGALSVDTAHAGSEKSLRISFTNFNNALGTHWHAEVGYFSQRRLYLSTVVQAIGDEDKFRYLVSYTFSLGEELSVGGAI